MQAGLRRLVPDGLGARSKLGRSRCAIGIVSIRALEGSRKPTARQRVTTLPAVPPIRTVTKQSQRRTEILVAGGLNHAAFFWDLCHRSYNASELRLAVRSETLADDETTRPASLDGLLNQYSQQGAPYQVAPRSC